MRTLLVLLAFLAAPAVLAQDLSDAEVDAAAQAALAETDLALADSMAAVMPEVFAAMGEAMAGMIAAMDSAFAGTEMGQLSAAERAALSEEDLAQLAALGIDVGDAPDAASPDASGEGYDALALYRRPTRGRARTYPVVSTLYGTEGDGFPAQTTIEGTVVSVGSLRLCQFGYKPVSRWLRVRLDNAPAGGPAYMNVAVECDEHAARHYVGRSVRVRAWKSIAGRPVRMAHDDVPPSEAPLYVSYPGSVIVR